MPRLKKRGHMSADDKSILLVNEENRAFRADDSSAVIWDLCDGKTMDELCLAVSQGIGLELKAIREPVEKLVAKMLEAGLVEWSEMD